MASTSTANENIIGKCIKDKYVVLKQIGQGGFGRVYLCENKYASSQRYAVKMIPLPKSGARNHHSVDPKTEIEIHRGLAEKKGRRFVKIMDDFELNGAVFIVMEYCEEGSLKDFVTRHKAPMDILLATDVLLQLVDALRLMHANKIMHRDLTASNVLIKEISCGQGGDVKRLHVKITDFGLSKRNAQGQLRTMLGTPAFMAPEVRAGNYTMAADVFSLGSIFYLLLTRKYMPGVHQMLALTAEQRQQQRKQMGHHIVHQQQQLDLERIWDYVWTNNESVRALSPEDVHAFLKSFLVGLLCREDNRITLDEIDRCEFIIWYRLNRRELDPEMDELCCSASLSGTPAGGSSGGGAGVIAAGVGMRRLSRSGGGGAGVVAVLVDINKDSALGSDNHSRSGNSRCRHPQLDPDTGRCRTCSYRPTSSNRAIKATTAASLMDSSSRPAAVASARALHPQSGRFESPLPGSARRLPPLPAPVFSAPTATRHAAIGKENVAPPPVSTAATKSAPMPSPAAASRHWWPFPSTVHLHNYVGINELGRCTFCRSTAGTSTSMGTATTTDRRLHLGVVFEKTCSKQDSTIECIVELWRGVTDGTAAHQELRIFEPITRHIRCPAKNDHFVEKAELIARIRSVDELASNRLAQAAYDTLCGFFRLAESKINQAYCEEIVNDRKWRLELRWNGFINVYEGARTARELDLKLLARQKTAGGPFEEVKGADPLSRPADRHRLVELAAHLRTEVNQSVWRGQQFDAAESAGGGGQARNIRCTIYTRGYT